MKRIKVRYKRPDGKFEPFAGVGRSVDMALDRLTRARKRDGAPRLDTHSVANGGRGLRLAVFVDLGAGWAEVPEPSARITKNLRKIVKRIPR